MDSKAVFKEFIDGLSPDNRSSLLNKVLYNDLIGINITDGKGYVVFLNDAHTRITGHPKELYLGKTMYEIEKEGAVSESATIKVLETGKPVMINQVTSFGKSFSVCAMPILDASDRPVMVLNLLTDVTEIVNSQKKVSELEEYANILKQAITGEGQLVYQSQAMQRIIDTAKRVAGTDVSVMVSGPPGVGKDLIADVIHASSPRRDKPFIKINCASIPEQLLESELFGYESGAFQGGGSKGKKGAFESASGGTLLLDDIGDLPLMLQSKLLRVMLDRSITRLGGDKRISVDVRLITATNSDLKEKVHDREFREDLYYRLNVIEIKVPPLEKRKEDIPLLVDHFIRLFNVKYDINKRIEPDALSFLCRYNYPGNVRELRNVVERMMIQSPAKYISVKDAYDSVGRVYTPEADGAILPYIDINEDMSLKQIMEKHEKAVLQEYIKIYKNGTELSRHLKTDQSTISRKLSKYGIKY